MLLESGVQIFTYSIITIHIYFKDKSQKEVQIFKIVTIELKKDEMWMTNHKVNGYVKHIIIPDK